MACLYPTITNSTQGFGGMITYINTAVETCYPTLGGQLIPLAILAPAWFIVFLILSRIDPRMAFPAASFLCMVVTIPLMAMGAVNPFIFGIFLVASIVGGLMVYMGARD